MSNDNSDIDKRKLPSTARSLPIALIRAREKVMFPIREMLSESGITEQQWRVLRVLSEYGSQDASKLAERAGLLPPSVTRIVQTMSQNGFVTQTMNKSDRRKQNLTITPEGQSIIDRNMKRASQISQGYVETLGQEDYEKLLDLLETLRNS